MASKTSSPTSTYWITWPVDALSLGSPSEKLLPSARKIVTPVVAAFATAARKATESLTGFEAVTKMIADIICGPAIIVIARGRIAWFMALAFSQRSDGRLARPERSRAVAPNRLCDRGCRRGGVGR